MFETMPKPKATQLEKKSALEAAEKTRREKAEQLKIEEKKTAEARKLKEAVQEYFREHPPVHEITEEDIKTAEEYIKGLEEKEQNKN